MTEPRDRELNVRAVAIFGIGLAVLMLVAAVAMWWFLVALRAIETANDPPPAIMPEARVTPEPPGPRLQNDPELELSVFRRHEEQILTSYGWVDREAGLARIPIARMRAVAPTSTSASMSAPWSRQ